MPIFPRAKLGYDYVMDVVERRGRPKRPIFEQAKGQ
jgi:hypothetical protein